jgi:hypothetical protein
VGILPDDASERHLRIIVPDAEISVCNCRSTVARSNLQFFSNKLPGVVVDERILVYKLDTANVAQNSFGLGKAEIWNLVMFVIALTSAPAMLAIDLLVGTENDKTPSSS